MYEFVKNNKQLGNYGEKLACDYLKKNGYKIIETNYHSQLGEIDIIAKFKKSIIFIEVKTRASEGEILYPQEAVDHRKQKRMLRVIEQYIWKNKIDDKKCQIDIIAISINKVTKSVKLKHLKNVFFDF